MIFQIQLLCAALAIVTLATANPLSGNIATASTASSTATGAAPLAPSCFPLSGPEPVPNNASDALSAHSKDCFQAVQSFLFYPTISQYKYLWYRMGPDPIPPVGEQPLPFTIERGSCVVEMDVLEDPKAFDKLALLSLQYTVVALFEQCVRPSSSVWRGGVVAVEPKKVLGVTIRSSLGVGGSGVDEKALVVSKR